MLLFLSFFCLNIYSQQEEATTDKGEKVILFENGTWKKKYSQNQEGSPADSSMTAQNQTAAGDSNRNTNLTTVPTSISNEQRVTESESKIPFISVIIVTAVFLLLLGIVFYYFLVIIPSKKIKPYYEALAIINENRETDFPKALQLLEKTIISGVKENLIADAWFAIAFLKNRQNKNEEALMNLEKVDLTRDNDTIYFILWLWIKNKKYSKCVEFYNKNKDKIDGVDNAKALVSLSMVYLGKEEIRMRNIEKAVEYFDRVKFMGIHENLIPKSISQHQIVTGIYELFDKNIDKARESFKIAAQQSSDNKEVNFEANLGLLLCEWMNNDRPNIDQELGKLIDSNPVPEGSLNHSIITEEKTSVDAERDLTPRKQKELTDLDLLHRNVRLWYTISLIFTWYSLKEIKDDHKSELRRRLNEVRKIDDKMSDPLLIEGLIQYFFGDETDREEAVKKIQESGVSLADTNMMIDREKKRKDEEKDFVNKYLSLVKEYLSDPKISKELRLKLFNELNRYKLFHTITDEVKIDDQTEETASIQDIQKRGELISKHIRNIIKNSTKSSNQSGLEKFEQLIFDMNETSDILKDNAHYLDKIGQRLMSNTGEFLLKEDEITIAAKKTEEDINGQ